MPSCSGISWRNMRPVMRWSGVWATWASITCMPVVSFTRGRFICGSWAKAVAARTAAVSARSCFFMGCTVRRAGTKNARAKRASYGRRPGSVLVGLLLVLLRHGLLGRGLLGVLLGDLLLRLGFGLGAGRRGGGRVRREGGGDGEHGGDQGGQQLAHGASFRGGCFVRLPGPGLAHP